MYLLLTSILFLFLVYYNYKIFDGNENEVTEDEVIYAWLKAEATDKKHQFASAYRKCIKIESPELEYPDFEDEEENEARRRVFNEVRGKYLLWKPISQITQWYKVLMEIGPDNKIIAPYPPTKSEMNSEVDLTHIILWAHKKEGPFLLLEGNHRFYARDPSLTYTAEVYLGLSNTKYSLCAEHGCSYCSEISN